MLERMNSRRSRSSFSISLRLMQPVRRSNASVMVAARRMEGLPGAVRGAFARFRARGRVDIAHARLRLVDGGISLALLHLPVGFPSQRVLGDLPQVSSSDEVVERLRCLVLVERVLVDERAELEEV